EVRRTFDALLVADDNGGPEYRLEMREAGAFVGASRDGAAALLVPLLAPYRGAGRAAGGIRLRSADGVDFRFEGKRWTQPAAILECTDLESLDAFSVLVLDVASRACSGHSARW